jgi:hypothetical protein
MIIRKSFLAGNKPDDDRFYSQRLEILDINRFGNMIGNNRIITAVYMQQAIGIIQAVVIVCIGGQGSRSRKNGLPRSDSPHSYSRNAHSRIK